MPAAAGAAPAAVPALTEIRLVSTRNSHAIPATPPVVAQMAPRLTAIYSDGIAPMPADWRDTVADGHFVDDHNLPLFAGGWRCNSLGKDSTR